MLKKLLVLGLFLLAPQIADAKTFKLGEEKPAAEITIPDGWETEAAEGAVEATSSDKAIYLSVDAIDAKDVAESAREMAKFLAAQKIKVKPETKKVKETRLAEFPTVDISWDATDEDGPTKLSLLLVKIAPQKVVMLTYWRSEAGEKNHGSEVDGIEKSLKSIR